MSTPSAPSTPVDPDACPTGCGRKLPMGMVMCRRCWGRVPKHLQREVWDAWEARQKVRGADRRRCVERHEEAKRAAIESVS